MSLVRRACRPAVLAGAALLTSWALGGCAPEEPPCGAREPPAVAAEPGGGGNVLVVLMDDVGVDRLAAYAPAHPETRDPLPTTPTIDCLCERGVRFTRAWGAPVCSPARAALYTGRLAGRTGLGANIGRYDGLSLDEITLGELARDGGFATGLVGKWHLDGWDSAESVQGPVDQGFDTFVGTLTNLDGKDAPPPKRGDASYDQYWRVVAGEVDWTTRYATTVEVDDALAFIDDHPEPWMLVLALHAAHVPVHVPPRHLVTHGVTEEDSDAEKIDASLEAADAELGRLFTGMDPAVLADTTVILAGDNGSAPGSVAGADEEHLKATLYEGGLRIPLVVTGPHVPASGVSDALVHLVDVVPTVAELLGLPLPAGVDLDGVSFAEQLTDPLAPGAQRVEAAWSPPSAEGLERAIRNGRFKLITHANGGGELFDLWADPGETVNLLWGPLDGAVADGYADLAGALAAPAGAPRY